MKPRDDMPVSWLSLILAVLLAPLLLFGPILVFLVLEPMLVPLMAPLERIANASSTSLVGGIVAVGLQGLQLFLILWGLPVVLLLAVLIGGNHLETVYHRRYGYALPRPQRLPSRPFTPKQHALYTAMRATGWSERASRQEAQRRHP